MRRLWTAAGLVWLPVAVLAGTWPAWSARLPERIATHWDGTGAADRFSPAHGFWIALTVIAVLAGLVAIGAAVAGSRAGGSAIGAARAGGSAIGARFLVIGSGATTGGTAGIWVATATATLAGPGDARLGWRFLYFVVGMAWAVVVGAAAGKPALPPRPATPLVDPMGLAPTERAAFSTTLRSPLLTGVTLAAAAIAVVSALTLDPSLWLVAIVPVALALIFGQVRVTADRRGLRVVAGLLGVPVKHIPLAAIVSAHAEEIVPLEWGGWGYRITPGRSALVLRHGPGLVLTLSDGRRFAVTMDRPEQPASVLLALQARAGS